MAKETTDTTELVVIKEQTAVEAFNDDTALEKMKADIKAAFDKQFPTGLDMNNKKDRAALRTAAAKIPKVKTRIEEFRKQATEEMRLKVASMTRRGNEIWDWLDEFHKEKRKPLTDWENEETERQNLIKDTIQAIRDLGQISFGETSASIQDRIDKMPAHELDFYAEFKDEAELVINDVYNKLVSAKQIATNAEKDAEERAAERAELLRLQEATAKSERERVARDLIADIKQAGAGALYVDGDFLTTAATLEWLFKLRIDTRFGDLVDEANDAREEALTRVQKKRDQELAEEEKEKARLQAVADQQAEMDQKQAELDAAQAKLDQAERNRIEAKAREDMQAEQDAENKRIADERAAAEKIRVAESRTRLQENTAEALDDIAAALAGVQRAAAPKAVLDAIIAGSIRHVSAADLMETGDE